MATWQLRDWIIDPSSNVLKNGKEVRRLSPKTMDVLRYLLERPGQVVSKDEIISEVWDGAFISEQVINNAIWNLRRAFDDDAQDPRFIETVPKRGYRLLGPVARQPLDERSPGGSVAGVSEASKPLLNEWAWLPAVVLLAAAVCAVVWFRPSPAFGDEGVVGSRLRPATSLPGAEDFPSLSPDGTQIAFSWNGGKGGGRHLYIQSLDSTVPTQLTFGPSVDRLAAWAPEGRRLAFHRADAEGRSGLYSIPVLGGEPELLVEKPGLVICPYSLDYSPDGDWLTFAAFDFKKGIARLFLHPLNGGRSRAIVSVRIPTFDTWPRFSPDSTRLAFVRLEGSTRSLFVWDLVKESLQSVLTGPSDLRGMDWQLDGKHLLFTDNDGIKQVSVQGGKPSLLVAGPDIHQISTSARSSRLVFEQRRQVVDIIEKPILRQSQQADARREEGTRRSLIASTWTDVQPALSLDGERIAFVSNRSGSQQLWVANRDGSQPAQLTDLEGLRPRHPVWSRDGRSLIFESSVHGTSDIYELSLEGGAPRRLTSKDGSQVQPAVSHSSDHLYYCLIEGRKRSIRRLSLVDGGDVMLVDGGSRPLESPDGKWLYYLRQGEVRRIPASGGPESVVTDGFSGFPHSWLLLGDDILFSRSTDGGFEIVLLDTQYNREDVLHRETSSRSDHHFASDSRSLLFTGSELTADLMLLDNLR